MTNSDQFKFSLEVKPHPEFDETGSLRSIFGDASNIEYQADKKSWLINSVLSDGVIEGGQRISCTVKKSEITNDSGSTFFVWNIDKLSVNDQEISDFFEAPVYLFRPSTDMVENEPWIKFATEMDAGFDYDFHRIYLFAGLQSVDQLVSLIHENCHVTLAIDNNEVTQTMKMYRDFMRAISHEIANGLNEDDAVEKGIKLLKESNIFDLVKIGAIETFNEEVRVNNLVYDFFKKEEISRAMFNDEDVTIRLKKLLTVLSLSYGQTVNILFGPGTVNPKDAEVQ